VHDDALKRLEAYRDAGHLSPADYQRVECTTRLQDVMDSVNDTVTQYRDTHHNTEKFQTVLRDLLERLGNFESSIHMLACFLAKSLKNMFASSVCSV